MENLESLALKYIDGQLLVLDQRLLPHREIWIHCQSPYEMCHMIKTLQVRGAPLIGIAAALALADYALSNAEPWQLVQAAEALLASRPTAVNLGMAIDRVIFNNSDLSPYSIAVRAVALFREDVVLCDQMANYGATLIADGDSLLTHCNTGSLVTAGVGTALGVIKRAWQQGKNIQVYVDETRPLLQGARLTTWELEKAGIPYTLISDNMAAALMQQGKIDKVFLGSDRIALNGDVANKIGTYNVAVIARHHNIPFYVVAPYTTVDFSCTHGANIPIEQREASEVRGFASVANDENSVTWAPYQARAINPAFDVTPVDLVTAIVLDQGIFWQSELKQGCLHRLSQG